VSHNGIERGRGLAQLGCLLPVAVGLSAARVRSPVAERPSVVGVPLAASGGGEHS